MQLTVLLFAALRERAGVDQLLLEDLPQPLDVAGLKRELAIRHPELGALESVAGVVGTDYVKDDHPLETGQEVALLPPVSGGQGESDEALAAGVFRLSADPIDVGALAETVVHPSCGAVVTFTGTTREHNREQDVLRLDYEAFHAMAGPEMERIFVECRERFGAGQDGGEVSRQLRMICVHRTGTVEVAQPSVVIAVASPHRAAAFEAARFLIDTLKERLPVWKKEVYEGGHHWIGDRS